MLFNSILFIFVFLPVTLAIYYAVSLSPLKRFRRLVLVIATLVFYGFGGKEFIPLLLGSMAFNYCAGLVVERLSGKSKAQFWALLGAIAGNIIMLAYFKYFNFMLRTLNDMFASGFEIERLILPLGISFFTFQQIGYLVDVSRGKMKAGKPLDYAGFVLFFPQLLAGPIVYYRETVPQLLSPVVRGAIGRTILIGLIIFAIGLFKKTVIADTAALYASPVFSAAIAGETIGFVDSWVAAFFYTAQIYFDFSGYSDMAIGTARMFGVILPLNFASPLRASSVVEIWRRWHVTLGRWVQNYIFQPMSLSLVRVVVERGFGQYGTLAIGVLIPTMISMLVVGVWHGAGWTFVLFGLMQGLYMATNETWATFRKKARKARKKRKEAIPGWHLPAARAATLTAFVLSIVPFGSPSLDVAWRMFSAMFGAGPALVVPEAWPIGAATALICLILLYAAIYLMPNTQQIMARFEPVLDWDRVWSKTGDCPIKVEWKMTAGWTLAGACVFFFAVAFIMRGTTQFIYFNF